MTWKPKDNYSSEKRCLCPVCGNDITRQRWKTIFYKYVAVCDNCNTKLEVVEENKLYFHVNIKRD